MCHVSRTRSPVGSTGEGARLPSSGDGSRGGAGDRAELEGGGSPGALAATVRALRRARVLRVWKGVAACRDSEHETRACAEELCAAALGLSLTVTVTRRRGRELERGARWEGSSRTTTKARDPKTLCRNPSSEGVFLPSPGPGPGVPVTRSPAASESLPGRVQLSLRSAVQRLLVFQVYEIKS
eukprot:2593486-Rhodomonas_salina.2